MEPITVKYKVLDSRAKTPATPPPVLPLQTCALCWMSR